MVTTSHDAAAVLRNLDRQAQLRARLTTLEADLHPHARRLLDAHGYRVALRPEQLRTLAETTIAKPRMQRNAR